VTGARLTGATVLGEVSTRAWGDQIG